MSSWDWINAGLELATLAKVHKAQQDIGSMKNAAQVEQTHKELINAMRNFIFEISQNIKRIDEYIESSPLQVMIVSKVLQLKILGSGLSPQMFPEISDKEYYVDTQRKIETIIKKVENQLNKENLSIAEKSVEYISEIPLLKEAVISSKAEENLNKTEEQWITMDKQRTKRRTFLWLGILAILPFVCGCPLSSFIAVPIAYVYETSSKALGIFLIILLILLTLALLVGAIWMIIYGAKSFPGYKGLKQKRQEWTSALLSQLDKSKLVSKFGKLSSVEYKNLLDQRISYLDPILSNDFQNLLLG